MVELQWRLLTTLFYTFTIAIAGTLAAAHYCSLLHYHCATSPNSGSEHSWGISLTQDSRDSDFDSDCHSNMVAVGQMSVPSHASAHRVDSLQAMLDCSASLPSASAETGCLASHSACSFRAFITMCSSARQVPFKRNCYRRDPGLPASSPQSHLATSSGHLQKQVQVHLQNQAKVSSFLDQHKEVAKDDACAVGQHCDDDA